MTSNDAYLGNPNLKKTNTAIEFTEEQIKEFQKCQKDPLYFIKNYVTIVSLDEGLIPFKTYKFQDKMIDTMHNNRFSIYKLPKVFDVADKVFARRKLIFDTVEQNILSEVYALTKRYRNEQ